MNLLLSESLFVVRVVNWFWYGDTFAKGAALTLIYRTFVVDFFDSSTDHLLHSLVELLVHLAYDCNVFKHTIYLRLATLLLPYITTW